MVNKSIRDGKCIAPTGNGRRCNKPNAKGSDFCKKHLAKSSFTNTNSKKKSFTKAELIGIALTLITTIISIALTLYFAFTGPTIDNQEIIKSDMNDIKEDLYYDRKNSDTIKYLLKALMPPTQEIFESDKNIFNAQKKEFEDLSNKIERAKKELKYYDSIAVWELKVNKMINEWERELKEKEYLYRELFTNNYQQLKNIFEYGYATYLITPDGKSKLMNRYVGIENEIELEWDKIKWSISNDNLGISIPNITFKDQHINFNNSHESFKRAYNDLGLLYYSDLRSIKIKHLYTIINENNYGILVLLGFAKTEISDFQQKPV